MSHNHTFLLKVKTTTIIHFLAHLDNYLSTISQSFNVLDLEYLNKIFISKIITQTDSINVLIKIKYATPVVLVF